jgi:hypothetical protein
MTGSARQARLTGSARMARLTGSALLAQRTGSAQLARDHRWPNQVPCHTAAWRRRPSPATAARPLAESARSRPRPGTAEQRSHQTERAVAVPVPASGYWSTQALGRPRDRRVAPCPLAARNPSAARSCQGNWAGQCPSRSWPQPLTQFSWAAHRRPDGSPTPTLASCRPRRLAVRTRAADHRRGSGSSRNPRRRSLGHRPR